MSDLLARLGEQPDPTVPLAIAALVEEATADGVADFPVFAARYRGMVGDSLGSDSTRELTGDEVHENLTRSVLPRLVELGLVASPGGPEWSAVRALGEWWPAASADRHTTVATLLAVARERAQAGHQAALGAGPRLPPSGSILEGRSLSRASGAASS
jgi:hypothetical protein